MAKWAERELERDVIRKERAAIRGVREELSAERSARRARLVSAAGECRAKLAQYKTDAKAKRQALARALEAERTEIRGSCSAGRERAREAPQLEHKRAQLEQLRSDQRSRRIWSDPDPLKRRASSGRSRAGVERQAESDDEVRSNIPEELWPVFNKHRARFKASARRSRTEAFEEWAAEHPSLVREALDATLQELPSDESVDDYEARMSRRIAEAVPF